MALSRRRRGPAGRGSPCSSKPGRRRARGGACFAFFCHFGLKAGAAWVLAEGADAAVMTRSVPIDKCLSDALIVFAQNGEAIRPEQGYPKYLLLPCFGRNT